MSVSSKIALSPLIRWLTYQSPSNQSSKGTGMLSRINTGGKSFFSGVKELGYTAERKLFHGFASAPNWFALLFFTGYMTLAPFLKDIGNIGAAFNYAKHAKETHHGNLHEYLSAIGWRTAINTMFDSIALALQLGMFFSTGNGSWLSRTLKGTTAFVGMGALAFFNSLLRKYIIGEGERKLILEDTQDSMEKRAENNTDNHHPNSQTPATNDERFDNPAPQNSQTSAANDGKFDNPKNNPISGQNKTNPSSIPSHNTPTSTNGNKVPNKPTKQNGGAEQDKRLTTNVYNIRTFNNNTSPKTIAIKGDNARINPNIPNSIAPLRGLTAEALNGDDQDAQNDDEYQTGSDQDERRKVA